VTLLHVETRNTLATIQMIHPVTILGHTHLAHPRAVLSDHAMHTRIANALAQLVCALLVAQVNTYYQCSKVNQDVPILVSFLKLPATNQRVAHVNESFCLIQFNSVQFNLFLFFVVLF
jgi:hypothetical protein